MYLTHTTNNAGLPVFVLVIPFERKDLARSCGFTWNQPQHGAWATENIMVACEPIKRSLVVSVAPETLDYIKANTQMTDATYDRVKAAYEAPTRKEQASIYAAILSDEQVRCVHDGLKYLAAVCDGAMADDGTGFNRNDIEFGHSLAAADQLTRSQAGHGKNILKKYRGQLGAELYACIFPELLEADRAEAEAKEQKKLVKGAAKKHKNGEACGVKGCMDSICMMNRFDNGAQPASVIEPIQLPASSAPIPLPASSMVAVPTSEPIGYTDSAGTPVVTRPEQIVVAGTGDDAEIARLARTLIDCHPGDFDTTVDLLRALRKVDAPKKGGSDFTNAAWSATGYKTV